MTSNNHLLPVGSSAPLRILHDPQEISFLTFCFSQKSDCHTMYKYGGTTLLREKQKSLVSMCSGETASCLSLVLTTVLKSLSYLLYTNIIIMGSIFLQSRSDSYRIVLYNVDNVFKIHRPLLVQRHNVIPGMFLVCSKFP